MMAKGGKMVKRPNLMTAAAGVALLAFGAAAVAQVPGGTSVAAVPAAASVSAFYSAHSAPTIWFRNRTADPAALQLIAILKRAPFDGLATGPQLAAQVEAALGQAQSGRPEDVAAAEQILST